MSECLSAYICPTDPVCPLPLRPTGLQIRDSLVQLAQQPLCSSQVRRRQIGGRGSRRRLRAAVPRIALRVLEREVRVRLVDRRVERRRGPRRAARPGEERARRGGGGGADHAGDVGDRVEQPVAVVAVVDQRPGGEVQPSADGAPPRAPAPEKSGQAEERGDTDAANRRSGYSTGT